MLLHSPLNFSSFSLGVIPLEAFGHASRLSNYYYYYYYYALYHQLRLAFRQYVLTHRKIGTRMESLGDQLA